MGKQIDSIKIRNIGGGTKSIDFNGYHLVTKKKLKIVKNYGGVEGNTVLQLDGHHIGTLFK
jgi:hypothetical protein